MSEMGIFLLAFCGGVLATLFVFCVVELSDDIISRLPEDPEDKPSEPVRRLAVVRNLGEYGYEVRKEYDGDSAFEALELIFGLRRLFGPGVFRLLDLDSGECLDPLVGEEVRS